MGGCPSGMPVLRTIFYLSLSLSLSIPPACEALFVYYCATREPPHSAVSYRKRCDCKWHGVILDPTGAGIYSSDTAKAVTLVQVVRLCV